MVSLAGSSPPAPFAEGFAVSNRSDNETFRTRDALTACARVPDPSLYETRRAAGRSPCIAGRPNRSGRRLCPPLLRGPHVDQRIENQDKHGALLVGDELGLEDHDGDAPLRPDGDFLDPGLAGERGARADRARQADLEAPPDDARYLGPDRLHDEPLIDRDGIEAACDQATT